MHIYFSVMAGVTETTPLSAILLGILLFLGRCLPLRSGSRTRERTAPARARRVPPVWAVDSPTALGPSAPASRRAPENFRQRWLPPPSRAAFERKRLLRMTHRPSPVPMTEK